VFKGNLEPLHRTATSMRVAVAATAPRNQVASAVHARHNALGRGRQIDRMGGLSVVGGHFNFGIFLASVKHQKVVQATEVKGVEKFALLVLEVVIPPRVNPLIGCKIGEHHWTLLQKHQEAIETHERGMQHQRDSNYKPPRALVVWSTKIGNMQSDVETHLNSDPQ